MAFCMASGLSCIIDEGLAWPIILVWGCGDWSAGPIMLFWGCGTVGWSGFLEAESNRQALVLSPV